LVLLASQAIVAGVAGPARRNRDAVTDRKSGYARTQGFDRSGDLVTEDHGLAHPHGAEAAMVEVVQVRSADTAGFDRDLDLAGRGHLNFTFLDPQITGRMNDDGLHGCTPRGWW